MGAKILAKNTKTGVVGYFTGSGFDTLKHKASIFPSAAFAMEVAKDLKVPAVWQLFVEPESRPKNPRKKAAAKKPKPKTKRKAKARPKKAPAVSAKRPAKSPKRAKRGKRSAAKKRTA